MLERRAGGGIVEMAAWRPFGPLATRRGGFRKCGSTGGSRVLYRHIRGITTGMDVVWRLVPGDEGTEVTIVHEWNGPAWPLLRRPAADWVIGPVFIHGIASRTLAGIRRDAVERPHD